MQGNVKQCIIRLIEQNDIVYDITNIMDMEISPNVNIYDIDPMKGITKYLRQRGRIISLECIIWTTSPVVQL